MENDFIGRRIREVNNHVRSIWKRYFYFGLLWECFDAVEANRHNYYATVG
jgi:hypothetical protein